MLKLWQVGRHKWEFVHPEGYDDTLEELDSGCDLYRDGCFKEAEGIFKATVEEIPDHLDGLHHWALIKKALEDPSKAIKLWKQAVSMGRRAFPQSFISGEDLLLWGFLGNRPFLRVLHGLGLAIFQTGDVKAANEIFLELLKLNPGDNQGVRVNAIESFFLSV